MAHTIFIPDFADESFETKPWIETLFNEHDGSKISITKDNDAWFVKLFIAKKENILATEYKINLDEFVKNNPKCGNELYKVRNGFDDYYKQLENDTS